MYQNQRSNNSSNNSRKIYNNNEDNSRPQTMDRHTRVDSSRRMDNSSRHMDNTARHMDNPAKRDESKEQVKLPPIRYKLTKLTQAQTLKQIACKTSGFYDMSIISADWIQRDVRSREFSSYGTFPAPQDMKIVQTIIGEDNYYLKLTTKKHNMDYIYYDDENGEFQFWGEYQCCIRALNEIRYRIHKIETRMVQKVVRSDNYDEDTDVALQHFSAVNADTDVTYKPSTPSYSPVSPSYSPVSPSYSPVSPSYCPTTPTYCPTTPFLETDVNTITANL